MTGMFACNTRMVVDTVLNPTHVCQKLTVIKSSIKRTTWMQLTFSQMPIFTSEENSLSSSQVITCNVIKSAR